MGGVSFDEEQVNPTRRRVKNRAGSLTALLVRFRLASNEREASSRLLAIAILFFLGTLFLFIQGTETIPPIPPADDPVLLDQTL